MRDNWVLSDIVICGNSNCLKIRHILSVHFKMAACCPFVVKIHVIVYLVTN